jgi:hypothetical protein
MQGLNAGKSFTSADIFNVILNKTVSKTINMMFWKLSLIKMIS